MRAAWPIDSPNAIEVTDANAAEFFDQPDIDGALVGGASLKEEQIAAILRAAQAAAMRESA